MTIDKNRIQTILFTQLVRCMIIPIGRDEAFMIQIIRKRLELSRKDISRYFCLSAPMIKSMELGQRRLSDESSNAFLLFFSAIQDVQSNGPRAETPSAASYYTRQMKSVHRKCCKALRERKYELKQMQREYTHACFSLGVYQVLAETLRSAQSKGDKARLKWAQWKIDVTRQQLRETDPIAQDFLAAEIAGLQAKIDVLEGTALFRSPACRPRSPALQDAKLDNRKIGGAYQDKT